jgi:hypothetical protein
VDAPSGILLSLLFVEDEALWIAIRSFSPKKRLFESNGFTDES